MGFNKKMINKKMTFDYLIENNLDQLYQSESLIFMDEFSSFVRDLFVQKKTEKEILEILNYKENEVSSGNQSE